MIFFIFLCRGLIPTLVINYMFQLLKHIFLEKVKQSKFFKKGSVWSCETNLFIFTWVHQDSALLWVGPKIMFKYICTKYIFIFHTERVTGQTKYPAKYILGNIMAVPRWLSWKGILLAMCHELATLSVT